MTNAERRTPVYFSFADSVGASGQQAATELVIRGLSARGWVCRRLPLPAFHDSGRKRNAVRFLLGLVAAWARSVRLLWASPGLLHVNMGQTRFAFLRDAVPLLLGRAGLGSPSLVVSLHSSLFTRWAKDSLDSRAFGFLVRRAGVVTVLGERQRLRLAELGVPGERIRILVNSCEVKAAEPGEVAAKQHRAIAPGHPIRALFLSSLIDTKGYPEFLEAVQRLDARGGPAFEAALCGRIAPTGNSERFIEPAAAEAWIEQQIAAINRGPRSRARWIRGAVGEEKAALFRQAEVFVLPTRYPVESQPIVLLEAMASGCAIVTTTIGEIPTILDGQCAVLLPAATADAVADALALLATDPDRRARLATAAHRRFVERYGLDRHLDAWEDLLGGMTAGGRATRAAGAT